jgi:hypothetical protein
MKEPCSEIRGNTLVSIENTETEARPNERHKKVRRRLHRRLSLGKLAHFGAFLLRQRPLAHMAPRSLTGEGWALNYSKLVWLMDRARESEGGGKYLNVFGVRRCTQ